MAALLRRKHFAGVAHYILAWSRRSCLQPFMDRIEVQTIRYTRTLSDKTIKIYLDYLADAFMIEKAVR